MLKMLILGFGVCRVRGLNEWEDTEKMTPERIEAIQELINRHCPAANDVRADVDPEGKFYSTCRPLIFRDWAIHVFDALLHGQHNNADGVTAMLKASRLLHPNGPGDENALCSIEAVAGAFRIDLEGIKEGQYDCVPVVRPEGAWVVGQSISGLQYG